MKFKSYLKLASASLALGTALSGFPALAETISWTGGSSHYYDGGCVDDNGVSVYCSATGNSNWNNGDNWSSGEAPTLEDDVNIGQSTYQSGTSNRPVQHDEVTVGEFRSGTDAWANNIGLVTV